MVPYVRRRHLISTAKCLELLVWAESCIERIQQRGVAEWLEEAVDGALFANMIAYALIALRSDEDYRDVLPATL
jgi:hypothetical protein